MDASRTRLNVNPKDSANFFSKMFFIWTLPIFKVGLTKVLEITDLYLPVKGDFSNELGDVLERHWTNQLKRKHPSLFRALLATFKWHVLYIAFLFFVNELFIRMYQPIMLGNLLAFFAPDNTMSRSEGMWYAGGVIALNFLSAFITNHVIVSSFHLGMRARVSVCSLIYRKSMRLSRTALGESAPGKVVNLLSNDVNRFDIASFFINYIWAAPTSAIIVMVLLFNEVGLSGIYGILVIFTVMPLQAYTGKLSARFRLRTAIRTDERTRLMDEIISGVQVIKMYAWEKPFAVLIDAARRSELKAVIKISYVRAIFMTFVLFTTRAAIFVTMLSLVFQGQGLSANRVFVFAQFFNILSHTMSSMFVRAITEMAEARVSIKRLQNYLNHDEFIVEGEDLTKLKDFEKEGDDKMELAVLENGVLKNKAFPGHDDKYAISIVDATSRWGYKGEPILKNIDLNVHKGRLIGVIGPVGSGKSSLLQMILGEMTMIEQYGRKGCATAHGVMSYACQEPWVFGGTVRQNILFGLPYNKMRYNDVIRVCALQKDMELFSHGDRTLVGERGTSLSGGQKARINLARAVYRQADVYLMDDPLSAVDAAVGRQLFEDCVVKFLRHKTRILVTHQLHLLKKADHIVVLIDGKVEMQGTFDQVSQSGLEFASLLDKHLNEDDTEDMIVEEEFNLERGRSVSVSHRHKMSRQISQTSGRTRRSSSVISGSSMLDLTEFGSQGSLPPQTLEAEASSKDIVEGSIFMHYVTAGGNYCFLLVILAMFLLSQMLASSFDYFVSYWTSQEELRAYYNKLNSTPGLNIPEKELNLSSTLTPDSITLTPLVFDSNRTMNVEATLPDLPSYDSLLTSDQCMLIHGSIVVALLIIATCRSFIFYKMCMNSSFKLHNLMFRGVIRSPMTFFDKNPSGRIMNRFSKDMGAIDESLPKAIMDASQMLLTMIGAIILSSVVNPIALAVLAVLFIVFYFVRRGYLKTSKNIKRLEGIARSPVFTHLNATLQGLPTIRAHNAQTILKAEFDKLQDTHTSAWYMFITTSSAFGFCLDLMCIVFVASVTFSFLFMTGILGDQVGLAITQAMSLTFLLQWGIRQSAEVENQLMAVERVVEYTQLPSERGVEPDDIDRKRAYGKSLKSKKEPPRGWPENARIVFDNLVMRYSDDADAPLVLKGLNFTIEARQKVGIVGRTGAGKSSIIQALFRLAFNSGTIEIDGVNISEISLNKLRSKISIIPQDPMLFSGTLRKNLDPFDEYSDQMLWDSLEEVELKEAIASGGAGLAGRVQDGGANFSVGQRQLVCLARALLRKNTILLMDEATANVDPYTDALIQQTIRSKFSKCTVLTIAHRLNTIMDSDIVVVMDAGLVVEFGTPSELLAQPEGHFTRMVNETKDPDEKKNVKTDK